MWFKDLFFLHQGIEYLTSSFRKDSSRTKNRYNPLLFQKCIVLGRNDTTSHNAYIWPTQLSQPGDQLRNKGFVARGQRRYTHQVHIIFNRLLSHLLWSLKQGSYIHIKTQVRLSGSNHLGPSVVTILPHFSHQNTWSPSFE